jgi:hypothetical protein
VNGQSGLKGQQIEQFSVSVVFWRQAIDAGVRRIFIVVSTNAKVGIATFTTFLDLLNFEDSKATRWFGSEALLVEVMKDAAQLRQQWCGMVLAMIDGKKRFRFPELESEGAMGPGKEAKVASASGPR